MCENKCLTVLSFFGHAWYYIWTDFYDFLIVYECEERYFLFISDYFSLYGIILVLFSNRLHWKICLSHLTRKTMLNSVKTRLFCGLKEDFLYQFDHSSFDPWHHQNWNRRVFSWKFIPLHRFFPSKFISLHRFFLLNILQVFWIFFRDWKKIQ